MTERADVRGNGGNGIRFLLIAVFAAGVLVTGWRGPYRSVSQQSHQGLAWDFGLVYSLTRAWVIGANPYEMEGVSRAWLSSDGPRDADPSLRRSPGILVYPPTTLAVLAPLGALAWSIASKLWLIANVAAMGLALAAAARVAGLRGIGLWGFLAAGVWLAPFATNMGVGQTAVVTLGLIGLGEWARFTGRHGPAEEPLTRGTWQSKDHGQPEEPVARGTWVCGALLGLATAIKPQMGLLFVVYEAGRMRWKSAAGAAAAVGLAAVVGAVRLQTTTANWWDYWRLNLHNFTVMEDGNPTRSNPVTRHQVLNLHYPLHNFTDDRGLVQWLVYGIVGALCLAYFVVDWRRKREKGEGRGELISLSMTGVVSLLVVYHRFYDAVLLVWPLALAVRLIVDGRQRWAGLTLLALCALFFVPGTVVMADAVKRGWVPAGIPDSWVWQNVAMPHETWAILAMAGLLVWIRARTRPEPAVN